MVHHAKGTVAGAGGFSTNPGSQRPILGTLAGIDPEARRVEKVVRKRRVKVEEIAPLLAETGVDLVPVTDLVDAWDVDEPGATLEENAALKARAAARGTGLPAVADVTGP